MKRTKPRRTRWSSTKPAVSPTAESRRGKPTEREAREIAAPTLGPYEAMYDVSHGYAHDRSIVIP